MLCSVCLHHLRTEVLKKRPRYAGEEVEVGRAVEPARQVGGDGLEVLCGWLDKVYDRDLAVISML